MIAKKEMPYPYIAWNKKWGSPFGRPTRWFENIKKKFSPTSEVNSNKGLFSLQPNNDTRIFEYPWAFFSANLKPGMRVLEIGGGLSGFQFVLSKSGMQVTNIDPGMERLGWPVNKVTMDRLNSLFKTDVTLINQGVEEVSLKANSFDCAFCISVIEHMPNQIAESAIANTYNALRPGGIFLLTIDLFPDVFPFTQKVENIYGKNMSVKQLLDNSGFEIIHGNKQELFGYLEFDSNQILENLSQYLLGSMYPVLVQTLILRKPEAIV